MTTPRFLALVLALGLAVVPTRAGLTKPFVPLAPAEPLIPALRLSLVEFGGVPDGRTLNTAAFDRALTALADKGGGTLLVPFGFWLTGPVQLRSHVRLHLEAGAFIQFSVDHSLYPLRLYDFRGERFIDSSSPLFGQNIEDVAITGAGIIDGGGHAWRIVKKAKLTPGAWDALVKSGGVLNPKGDEWWPSQAALDGRAAVEKISSLNPADYEPWHQYLRPKLLRLVDCRRVLLEGVTFQNAPNWTLNPALCEDVTLRDLKISNPKSAQNSDAMDIESCRRVLVRGCVIDTGDDGICLKSGKDAVGRRIGVPTEDVLIENCTVYDAHGGFVIGSEMSGGVRRVRVDNCIFIGTAIGLRFKTARGRGGVVEDIHVSNIRMRDIENDAINFNFSYANKGQAEPAAQAVDEGTPRFGKMLFENIICRGAKGAFTLRGLPEMPLHDLTLRNVSISADRGAELGYCDGIEFDRVEVLARAGEPLHAEHVTNSKLSLRP